ncbi:MAG TPA: phosphatidylglycerol lysyltransferase domain-containing protein [Candidatus Obscuribacterales bacterium]
MPDAEKDYRQIQVNTFGVWFVSAAAFIAGLLDVILGLSGDISDRPRLVAFALHSHWSKSLIVACGLTLVYLAINLAQRKRIACLLALTISGLSVASHAAHHDFGAGFWLMSVFFAATSALRSSFSVKSEPVSIKHGLLLAISSLGIAITYGTAGFWFMDHRDFGIDFGWGDSIMRTLREFLLIGNADLDAKSNHARWFLQSLKFAGGATIAMVTYSLFRPLRYHLETRAQERAAAKEIVKNYGRSSMDFYKLSSDKAFFFSKSRKSFIAYRLERDVAVCLADPVGPEDERRDVVAQFQNWCTECGWLVCFLQAEPDYLPVYTELGFTHVKIGEEARIDLEKFSTTTMRKKDFRGRESKFKGFSLVRHDPPHNSELLDSVESISNEWLSLPGRSEHHFTLGRFDRAYINTTPLYTLVGSDGKAIAFVNEVPSSYPGEISIDLMRHRSEVPSGTMDYLFLKLLQQYRERGYRYFNLGLAALAGVGETPDAALKERALHQLFEHLNRFFSYKGLRRYKQKFDPIWENRYFIYRGGPARLIKCVLAFKKVTGY